MYPVVKRRAVYEIFIVVSLFFFFAPVVPTSVSPYLLRPLRNPCGGIFLGPEQVFTSMSYIVFGLVIAGTVREGAFGLVYVPNSEWDTIQFPPLGFLQNIALCG